MDLQARREARRRKILENSENRLKKITTVTVDDKVSEAVQSTSAASGSVPKTRSVLSKEPESRPVVEQRSSNDLRTIYQNPIPNDDDSVSELEFTSYIEKDVIFRNWIIILLAMIVRYLYFLSDQYAQIVHVDILVMHHLNKIFLPFVIYQVTEYAFFRRCVSQSGLLNVLFMLNVGIRVENMQKLINMFRITLQILQNMMIYIFAFVCFDLIIAVVEQESN